MRTYPNIEGGRIWCGELLFSPDRLEPLIDAITNVYLNENMTNLWGFRYTEDDTPLLTAQISWLAADPEAGRAAFSSLYCLDLLNDSAQLVEYTRLHDDTEGLCEDGGRKPGWHVGLRNLDYAAWQEIYDLRTEFVDRTNLTFTTILTELYSIGVLREDCFRQMASCAHRDVG